MQFNRIAVFLVLFIAIFATFYYGKIQKSKEIDNNIDSERTVLRLNTSGLRQVAYYIDEDNKLVETIHDYGTVELDDSLREHMKTLKKHF